MEMVSQILLQLTTCVTQKAVESLDTAVVAKLKSRAFYYAAQYGVAFFAGLVTYVSAGTGVAVANSIAGVWFTNFSGFIAGVYDLQSAGYFALATVLFGMARWLFQKLIPGGKQVMKDLSTWRQGKYQLSAFVANITQTWLCGYVLTRWFFTGDTVMQYVMPTVPLGGFGMHVANTAKVLLDAGMVQISVALFRTACQSIAGGDAKTTLAEQSASKNRLENAQTAARQAMRNMWRNKTDAVVNNSDLDSVQKMRRLMQIEQEEEEKSAHLVARAGRRDPKSYRNYLVTVCLFGLNCGEYVRYQHGLVSNLYYATCRVILETCMFTARTCWMWAWGKENSTQNRTQMLAMAHGFITIGDEGGKVDARGFLEIFDDCEESLRNKGLHDRYYRELLAKCKRLRPKIQAFENGAVITGGDNAVGSVANTVLQTNSVLNTMIDTSMWSWGKTMVWVFDKGNTVLGWVGVEPPGGAALKVPGKVESVVGAVNSARRELVSVMKNVESMTDEDAKDLAEIHALVSEDFMGIADTVVSMMTPLDLNSALTNSGTLNNAARQGAVLPQKLQQFYVEHEYALMIAGKHNRARQLDVDATPVGVDAIMARAHNERSAAASLSSSLSPMTRQLSWRQWQVLWETWFPPDSSQSLQLQLDQNLDRVDDVMKVVTPANSAVKLLNNTERALANPATLTPPQARGVLKDLKNALHLIESIDGWQTRPLIVAQIARMRSLGRVYNDDGAPLLTQRGLDALEDRGEREAWVREVADFDKHTRAQMIKGLAEMHITNPTQDLIDLGPNTQQLVAACQEALTGFENFADDVHIADNIPNQPLRLWERMMYLGFAGQGAVWSGKSMLYFNAPKVHALSDTQQHIKANFEKLDPVALSLVWETIQENQQERGVRPEWETQEGVGRREDTKLIGTRADQEEQEARDAAQGKKPNFADKVVENDGKPSDSTRDPTVVPSPETRGASEPFSALPFAVPPADAAPGAVLPLRVHYRLAERDDDDDTC